MNENKPDANRPYRRTEIDKVFEKVKAAMHLEAVKRGNGNALYQDCYTGKQLNGGDLYDYEHIYSSEWVHSAYKHILTDEQIALVANCTENVGVTLRTLNQSKGKTYPWVWVNNLQNIERHGIDLPLATIAVKRALQGIESMVRRFS